MLEQLAPENEEYESCKSSTWKECKTKVSSISSPASNSEGRERTPLWSDSSGLV